MTLKEHIKKILPAGALIFYHWFLGRASEIVYGFPSNKLVVIGVTGTNGKTTVVNLIWQLLTCQGQKCGLSSTVNFFDGKKEIINDQKMTMLGRLRTQKLLRQMVKNGCRYAVIETSSQGIEQYRHLGINYDVVVFTNLTPEHIEAHGGFENYRAAKEKLFRHLSAKPATVVGQRTVPKIIVSNADDKENERLGRFTCDKFVTYSVEKDSDYKAISVESDNGHYYFSIKGKNIRTNFLGRFSVYNVLAALCCVEQLGFKIEKTADCHLSGVPGRQEFIDSGQNFKVMVDYAPEPEGLHQIYRAIKEIKYNKLIHVLGSAGGGRDKGRQPIMGELAGQTADYIIVTNEDPYDDDPWTIINNVAAGAIIKGKIVDKNLFKILDRQEAINKAVALAQENDLVLITGKGAEQAICVANNKKIPWDDRQAVKKALQTNK